ncbi:MAG: hypothetical protein IJC10_03180 [Clostridia bacterium]|nr:hypothetical protein [Clostridia bacterium]
MKRILSLMMVMTLLAAVFVPINVVSATDAAEGSPSYIYDYGLTAVAEFDQTIWAPDMPELTATIRYNAPEGNEKLIALCGMYDINNRMVSSDIEEFTLVQGEGKAALSMETVAEAVKAKVFLWEAGTYSPIKEDVAELTKTTDGKFIYVSSTGSANTEYGYKYPFGTVEQAVSALKTIRTLEDTDVYVILMPGYHKVTSTIKIDAVATESDYKTVFTSYNKNDKGIISGGTVLKGSDFTLYEKGIYRATVPVGTQSRQLYVNGIKGVRARSAGRLANCENLSKSSGGLKTTDVVYKTYAKPDDLECVFYSLWTNSRCGVASITDNGDNTITLNMDSIGWTNINDKDSSSVKTPAWIENAYELIDEGGEWYLDEEGNGTNGYIYYLPRDGEDMSTAEVVLPTFDNYSKEDGAMFNISGTAESLVKNVEFNGIEFSHTTWTRPSTEYGHSDVQNNHIREKNNPEVSSTDRLCEGAIDVKYADNIDFLNCDFTRLGITALRILDGADNCDVTGNEFFYISGSAVNVGHPYQGTYGASASGKTDEKYILDNINVTNNYIHHVANDYWSAAAISAGHPRNSTIKHNEICNIPYSGMHIGYGWSLVTSSTMTIEVENNYIHDLFQGDIYDGAGIYTIGGTGGTVDNPCTIKGNFIENIGPGAATLYNDQGSKYWLVENNVSDISDAWGEVSAETYLYKAPSNCMNINADSGYAPHYLVWRNNYSSNNVTYLSNGSKNDTTIEANAPILLNSGVWSAEAQAIIANAGIQEQYFSNFEFGLRQLMVKKEVSLSNAGATVSNTPYFITGKNTRYKSNDLSVIDVKSSNAAVATATEDKIVAMGDGEATITYTVLENGIYRTATTNVKVGTPNPYRIEFEDCVQDSSLIIGSPQASGYAYIHEANGTSAPAISKTITIRESGNYNITYLVGYQTDTAYLSKVTIKLGSTEIGNNAKKRSSWSPDPYDENLYDSGKFTNYASAPMCKYSTTKYLTAGTYELTATVAITSSDSKYKYQLDYIEFIKQ